MNYLVKIIERDEEHNFVVFAKNIEYAEVLANILMKEIKHAWSDESDIYIDRITLIG